MSDLESFELGLTIEQLNVFLPWNITLSECLSLVKDLKQINASNYSFHTSVLGIPFVKDLIFHFSSDKLSQILLFSEYECNDSNLMISFCKRQTILEKSFGKPTNQKLLAQFFTKMNKDDKEYSWKFKKIEVTHKIWDRFGLEEQVIIHIKDNL